MNTRATTRSVPRKLALQILTEVLGHRNPLDEAIEARCARDSSVSSGDRAWLTEITSGVVRHLRRIDLAIDAFALKKKPAGKVRKILQIAVYQLLHQDRVFPATVVSETVDLVRAEEGEPPAKFANALLRKVADTRAEWRDLPDPGERASVADKATWASIPDWWWKKFEVAYGYGTACKIARGALERPETWFRVRAGEVLSDAMEAGPVPGSARLRSVSEAGGAAGGVATLPGFREGDWIVQDLASQRLTIDFFELLKASGNGMRVLDRCAAPGGKSVGLAWLGADVTATDPSEPRRKLLTETVMRAAPGVKIVGEKEIISSGPYDAVWIDAPCSGSGILRRHPDVRWIRQESDLKGLVETQARLLREAFTLVAKGGLVFYSVCSLFPEEGKNHLRALEDLGRVRMEVRLGPDQVPSCDGFFGFAIEKV